MTRRPSSTLQVWLVVATLIVLSPEGFQRMGVDVERKKKQASGE
ncbi:hypothetical protein [Komagataeibacter medellinensis]|nr:hypothetical protein [Komagataeibacter medellinensis]